MAFSGGSGTQIDPYLISTAADINDLRNYTSNTDKGYLYFKQTNDIDLSGYSNFIPIGGNADSYSASMTGSYNGGGFKITGLTINKPSDTYVGLFGYFTYYSSTSNIASEIKNVSIISANIIGGSGYTGGLVGEADGVNIFNCFVSGTVKGTDTVGGIVGYFYDYVPYATSAYMDNCSSSCNVTALGTGTYSGYTGGLVGNMQGNASKCFSYGGTISGKYEIGGMFGDLSGNATNCWCGNAVSGTTCVGGFAGYTMGDLINCHSYGSVTGTTNVGGFIGYKASYSTITSCYYDSQTSGQSDTGKGTPQTTVEMKTQSTFVNWDFTAIWAIDLTGVINSGYPYLWIRIIARCAAFFKTISGTFKRVRNIRTKAEGGTYNKQRSVKAIGTGRVIL